MGQSINQSLPLKGRVVTKGRDIINVVKDQPLSPAVSLDVSDRIYRLKFRGFAVEFFAVLLISQNFAGLS